MKILVCGMPRSMTTWAFNILRELIVAPDARYLWIAPGSAEEREFAQAEGPMLAKCHHHASEVAKAADLVVYSYRDLRAAAVSYHRKFGSDCSREHLETWLEAERAWLPLADVVLRYEDVEREPVKAAAAIRAALVRKAGGSALDAASDEEVVARVESAFQKIEASADVAYDASTMILPRHRTFQPSVEALSLPEKALYDRVERDFSQWLQGHGYMERGEYGQEVEYAIAEALMRSFDAPMVIDVGVERGSFAALALAAGSPRVIGFEPLPRHLEHLARRFPEGGPVQVHPFAISDRDGIALLHVATDREGRELDYHHTLSDLGDSATVIRTQRALEVRTASLGELAANGTVSGDIHFLKVDTDGHDLSVLRGLGKLRPRVIMAEFWDTLPESSGANPYALRDLVEWATAQGYSRALVVRRHGRIELVHWDAPWTLPGDWGNVFFLASDVDVGRASKRVEEIAKGSYEQLCAYVRALMRDTEAKEAEIRRLDAALQQSHAAMRAQPGTADLHRQLEEKEAVIQDLAANLSRRDAAVRGVEPAGRPVDGPGDAQDAMQRAMERLGAQQALLARALDEKESVSRTLQESLQHLQAQHREFSKAVEEKDEALRKMHAVVSSPQTHLSMSKSLEEKEAVIQELSRAVAAYRSAFSVFGFLIRPLSQVVSPARRVVSAQARLLKPKLGNLNQHPPIKLRLGNAATVEPAATPRVSIVTPSFKQAGFIERTMRSVLDQQYPNLEYVVQDGGYEDGTREILERYSGRLAAWESAPDCGQAQAINRAFAKTSGEIMAWLNSDDILLPGALAHVVDYLNRHPDVDVVYGHRVLIDENDDEIGRWVLPSHDDGVLSWADFVPQETLFWRRRIWDKAGGQVDESFSFALDWDMLVRFRKAGARFARIPRFLGGFRIHEHQKTSAVISGIGFQEMDRIRARVLGRIPSQTEVRNAVAPYLIRHIAADLGWRIRNRLGVA